MYEEPYRWVEAVGNRRHYLDEQFKQGSPVVAISFAEGILLLTLSRGTPKLYEIYDRIALGGMGHPADLEKLRFNLLDMAHLEGFQRSPSDVTGTRLVKYGLAPVIKQAFEEIFKAPFIAKILLAELGHTPELDSFLTLDYDGSFEEVSSSAVICANGDVQKQMSVYIKEYTKSPAHSLDKALELAVKTWSVGSLRQEADISDPEARERRESSISSTSSTYPEETTITDHLRQSVTDKTMECAVLDRRASSHSTYRSLSQEEVVALLPQALQGVF